MPIIGSGGTNTKKKDWLQIGVIMFTLMLFFVWISDHLNILPHLGLTTPILIIGFAVIFFILLYLIGLVRSGQIMSAQTLIILVIVAGAVYAWITLFPTYAPYLASVVGLH